ncbi:hypothetical protein CHS0354_014900 [Potamilus streckersoni]|uniref:Uncharacterized protein n=1 Tax=Potamilus streckersoni TaxID=2493646 RepID=A0AAE0SAL9_9BIVA|nr:hypothetical protein CHS0354_014900 [Potamilus streckersoni]
MGKGTLIVLVLAIVVQTLEKAKGTSVSDTATNLATDLITATYTSSLPSATATTTIIIDSSATSLVLSSSINPTLSSQYQQISSSVLTPNGNNTSRKSGVNPISADSIMVLTLLCLSLNVF